MVTRRKPRPEAARKIKPLKSDALDFLKNLGSGSSTAQEPLSVSEPEVQQALYTSAADFDIEQLFAEVQESVNSMPRDLKFDDSEMPEAPNFLAWCTGNEYLAYTPFLEQVLIGLKLFSEYCPNPSCSDVEWMDINNHEPTEGIAGLRKHVTPLEYGICPKCGARRTELIKAGLLPVYNQLACCAGQRSGKSIVTALLTSYQTHRIIKMQNPTKVYGVGSNQILHITFVAITKDQAKDTLWEPYYGFILDSPWFRRYHALIKRYELVYGVEVLKILNTYVLYRHRNLLITFAGPDRRSLRGRTRIGYGIDEIGYFDNDAAANKVKTGADEIYVALERSCITVRACLTRFLNEGYDNFMLGYGYNISSPVDFRDKICTLLRQAKINSSILGIHAPTWKMNPNIPRDDPSIVDAYKMDPVTAERDLGANPPHSSSTFLTPVTIDGCKRDVGRNEVQYLEQTHRRSVGGQTEQTRYGVIRAIKESGAPSVMAMDAGETNNSFALSVVSRDKNARPSVDLLIEIMPTPGIPLNYTMIFDNIIVPVCKKRNVKILLADRWNSTKLLQDALALELVIRAHKYSLKYSDMVDIKNQMLAQEISYPRPQHCQSVTEILEWDTGDYPACFAQKPVEHLMFQMLTIQDRGNMVTKGTKLTDDLWRASALALYGINVPDYAPYLEVREAAVKAPVCLGIVSGNRTTQASAGARTVKTSNFVGIIRSRAK